VDLPLIQTTTLNVIKNRGDGALLGGGGSISGNTVHHYVTTEFRYTPYTQASQRKLFRCILPHRPHPASRVRTFLPPPNWPAKTSTLLKVQTTNNSSHYIKNTKSQKLYQQQQQQQQGQKLQQTVPTNKSNMLSSGIVTPSPTRGNNNTWPPSSPPPTTTTDNNTTTTTADLRTLWRFFSGPVSSLVWRPLLSLPQTVSYTYRQYSQWSVQLWRPPSEFDQYGVS